MKKKNYLLLLFILFSSVTSFAQAVGDFGSIASGNYTAYTTWGIWNGATFAAAPAGAVAGVNYPDRTKNIWINSPHVVVVNSSGVGCLQLNVNVGGKIWANSLTNFYLYVFGDIVDNGMIGNGATFDGISLGIEGTVCTATGTGSFDVSRIRKNTVNNPSTTFNINRDINLRFGSSSQTQIYNNATAAPTRFDVVIAAGATLNLTSNGFSSGNAAVDADLISLGNSPTAGGFTINGTMIVSGITYLTSNNNSIAIGGASTVAGSNIVTVSSTASLVVGATLLGSGAGVNSIPIGSVVTAILSGTTVSISKNAVATATGFSIYSGGSCSWVINPGGILRTAQVATLFTNFSCTSTNGSMTITTASTTGLTVGMVVNGTGVNGTITSIVNATTFTISSNATSSGSSTMSFSPGSAEHLLRIYPGGTMEVTGSTGFSTPWSAGNATYDVQNGSYFEYSGLTGIQNVYAVPASATNTFGFGSGAYGYLKISGSTLKTMLSTITIANDLNIVNTSGAAVLQSNNNNINIAGSWYNYNTSGFTEGLGTVIFNGAAVQTITTPGGERYYNLRYSKSAPNYLQFNSPVNVGNQLQWSTNGPYFLNSNRLTIESANTLAINNASNAARYIISETVDNSSIVQWNVGTASGALNYVFPFGKPGGAGYIPFTYSITTGTIVGNLSVATYGTPANNLPWPVSPYVVTNLSSSIGLSPDNRDATVDRFWEIDVTAALPPTATVTFTYTVSELPIAPYNNAALLQAQWYDKPTDNWIAPISGQTNGNYFTTTPGLVTYGAWTLAAITSPLPIELLSFTAKANDENVFVNWITSSEINNDYFTVERSEDAEHFFPIGKISGAGNSTVELSYKLIDNEPLKGISYYRLKQTDFDGKYSYSQTVAVEFKGDRTTVVEIGPNPAKDYLRIASLSDEDFTISIYQLDGKLVMQETLSAKETSTLDVSGLSKGMYLVKISSTKLISSQRLFKN
jgi:hypothetical protein